MSKSPPPLPGSEPINEPHIEYLGRTFSESEYLKAVKHNRLRWMMSMGLGIPAFLILTSMFSFLVAVGISMGVLPGIYFTATAIFPGSKKHGTVLFDRYKSQRNITLQRFEKTSNSE